MPECRNDPCGVQPKSRRGSCPPKREREARTMKIERRLRALESKMLADPVILYFADCSKQDTHGPRNFLLDLFVDACRGADLSPRQAAELDLIRNSVGEGGASCAQMTQIIRCFLLGPAEGPSSVTPVRSSPDAACPGG